MTPTQPLHEALLAIKQRLDSPLADWDDWFSALAGICPNVAGYVTFTYDSDALADRVRSRLAELTDSWPERNENPIYPVGGWDEYYGPTPKWKNPRRLALLDWLIEQTETNP